MMDATWRQFVTSGCNALFGQCLLIGLALLASSGCNDAPSTGEAKATYSGAYPIRATATVGMVADLVRDVGGAEVKVNQLLSSGVDPHLYKPTRDDVQAILSGDIVFYNGLMLEGKMAETLERLGKSKPTCAVASGLKLPEDIAGANLHHPDPHVWMDVSIWSEGAQAVGDFFQRYDPPHAADYAARTETLRQRLGALHKYGQTVLGSIHENSRVLITSHDAFRYFGRAYGLEVQAIQGISTESEAGLQRINQLVDLLVDRKIQAVFVESSVPKESIEALLEGAAARGHSVKIGGELYSDAMGADGTYEGTYIGMMDHNITTIAHALGAQQVPEGGFKGLQGK
jgi:manganese/zinc/iron transport system substrate-binding protein